MLNCVYVVRISMTFSPTFNPQDGVGLWTTTTQSIQGQKSGEA